MGIFEPRPVRHSAWAATRWSVISSLDTREAPGWEASWDYVVRTYLAPMERYVRRILSRTRGRPVTREEASEVVQDFLATCVEKGWLSRADPVRGRFRAYLQVLLRRYAYRSIQHATAKRRNPGPGKQVRSLFEEEVAGDISSEERDELEEFDRAWVKVAVDRTLERLGREHERYQAVVLDLIATDGEGSEDLAQRLGVRRAQFPVLKHRARQRFLKLFEEELSITVSEPEAYAEELRLLAPYLP